MADLIPSIRAARKAGFSVIPIKGDGSKMPPFEWNRYRTEPPTADDLRTWFVDRGYTGYAVICGPHLDDPTMGAEVLDFDVRDRFEAFCDTAEASGLGALIARIRAGYEERTPAGGAHLLYRCREWAGNTKLARQAGPDPDNPRTNAKAIIETRGAGGYFIAAPSNGTVHPSGGEWRMVSGGFATIAEITPEERAALWDLARAFDELPPVEVSAVPRDPVDLTEDTPINRFRRAYGTLETFTPYIEQFGWKLVYARGGVGYFRRPGKQHGVSASFGWNGTDYFYVFSSSTAFEPDRAYNPFSVSVVLEHGGDVDAAVYKLSPTERVLLKNLPVGKPGFGGPHDGGDGGDGPGDDGDDGTPPRRQFNESDYGNAERLVARGNGDLRFSHELNQWYIWDGTRFAQDKTGAVIARAKDTIRSIYVDAANEDDPAERKRLVKHALKHENVARLTAMVTLAQSEPGVPVTVEDLDRDPWLLNMQNGTLDLRTGALQPHDRTHLMTKRVEVAYDPDATCPRFLAFLDRIMGGNADLVTFLQRAIGYSLTGLTTERVIMILFGEGKNGKSTFLEVFRSLLGDYAMRTPTETLLAKRESGIPNDVARLRGLRFVTAAESEEGQRLAEAKIKDMTGGDVISARFMRGEFFDFMPTFKIWLSTNHKPVIRGTDQAIWDRIRLVPFNQRIPPHEQDNRLGEKLREEAPGILAWAVQGCLAWQRDGLGEPSEVRAATDVYRAEMDRLAGFIDESCEVSDSASATAYELYQAYQKWCDAGGEHAMTKTMFGKRLGEKGFDAAEVGRAKTRTWIGIGLKHLDTE